MFALPVQKVVQRMSVLNQEGRVDTIVIIRGAMIVAVGVAGSGERMERK